MLLFRYSRLWYCPTCKTNNTEAHAVCIYTRRSVLNTHHGRLVSQCLDKLMKFTRFRIAKTKRKTLFSICPCSFTSASDGRLSARGEAMV